MERPRRPVRRGDVASMIAFPLRGQIYLVRLPGHPLDHKTRPALVVSLNARNRMANDVLVVPLSTTLRPAPTHVLVEAGEGGLNRDSMAKCEQVTTLDKSFLFKGPLGTAIRPVLMREVEKAILRAIGVPIS